MGAEDLDAPFTVLFNSVAHLPRFELRWAACKAMVLDGAGGGVGVGVGGAFGFCILPLCGGVAAAAGVGALALSLDLLR